MAVVLRLSASAVLPWSRLDVDHHRSDALRADVTGGRRHRGRVTDNPASRNHSVGGLGLFLVLVVVLVVIASGAKTFSLNDQSLSVVHQSVDDGRGQGVVDVEDLAPLAKGTIGGDHDRAALVPGRDDLEHEIGPSLVDRKIA